MSNRQDDLRALVHDLRGRVIPRTDPFAADSLRSGHCWHDPIYDKAADAIERLAGEALERELTITTELWGHPVGHVHAALNFLEEHTGTTIIPAAIRRLELVLRGQRDLIVDQAKRLAAQNPEARPSGAQLERQDT